MNIEIDDFILPSKAIKAYVIVREDDSYYRITYEHDKLGNTFERNRIIVERTGFILPDNATKAIITTKEKNTYYTETYKRDELGNTFLDKKTKIGTLAKLKLKYIRHDRHITAIGKAGLYVIAIIA